MKLVNGSAIKQRAWRAGRSLGRSVDRRLFPEATSAAGHWQRAVMDSTVRSHLVSLGPPAKDAVEISGDAQGSLPWRSYESLNYPEFDLCASSPPQQYDVVVCEQVLEHVVDPWAAARNLRQLCRPGGHVVVTTPFLIPVHELPLYGLKDYWRFTPRGLRTLLEGVGLEVATVGSWGNRVGVWGNLDHWTAYRRWLPLGNRPTTPLQVWAFARNPT